MSKRIRLLKVIVQPIFVLDDGDNGLTELTAEPVTVAAQDWPTYATTTFLQSVDQLREQFGAEP